MKKYLYSILLGAGLFFGCEDNFLEIPPEDALSQTVFFQTQQDFVQAINATYAPLRNVYADAFLMGEMRSDNTHYRHNPNFRAVQSEENIANFLVQSPNAFVETKYDNNFLIIARANQILAELEPIEFEDAAVKSNVRGQALFLRALSYFDLAQYYGSVPLHLVPVTTREDAALPLSSNEEILSQVQTDLEEAISLLPAKSSQEAGRATRGSAQMLLANLLIVQENWSAASSALSDIVNSGEYELQAEYASAFDLSNKNNSESIFEVQYLEGTEGFASSFMYDMLPKPLTAEEVAAISGVPGSNAETNEGFNIPTPDYINSLPDGDARTSVNLDSVQLGGTFYPYVKKYWQPHSNPGLTGVNWPVYRYAEALLFYAEALNESGSTGEAETYLNQVRARAGLAPVTGLDQTAMAQAIQDERRWELAFENKRWLDLVRTGNAQQVMSAFGQRVKDNPQDYYYPDGIAPPPASFGTINELFPLPASEALLNPNF